MEMKWHPIIDGDLSGIPRDESLLFTGIDNGELYVEFGYIESLLEKHVCVYIGANEIPVEAKEVIAWMEIPEPYQPAPDKCFKCVHGKLQHDESSDNWFECELLQRDVPPNDKPNDCPLEK